MTTRIVNGTITGGYTLAGQYSTLSITANGEISGGVYGVVAAQMATILNNGYIIGSSSASIELKAGGSVTNGSASDTDALINQGVYILNSVGQVNNFATITAYKNSNNNSNYIFGVLLNAGGTVTNGSGSDYVAIIEGAGVSITNGTGSVKNFGKIVASNMGGTGAYLGSGQVTNGSVSDTTALISGGATGLAVSHLGSLSNFGTVAGGALGVRWAGGSLNNGSQGDTLAQISGAYGVSLTGAATTLKNFGQILGASGGAVYVGKLTAGAAVTLTNGAYNDATALISGGKYGISVNAATATVTNYGTIAGTGGTALTFNSASDLLIVEGGSAFAGAVQGGGGTLQLASGTGTLSGLGSSFSGFASYLVQSGGSWTLSGTNTLGAATTLTNRGTLTAAALFKDTGSIANFGVIASGVGVYVGSGQVTNGSASNTTALISGGATGLAVSHLGSLSNFGTVAGGALGVRWVGGSLINGPQGDALAQITGAYGVSLTGAATTLKNFGQILGASGGAVYVGKLTAGAAVTLTNGAYNDATALISGGKYGISVNAATATVTNYGIIAGTGGTALTFNSASDLLIVEGGSAFAGAVQGGGGTLQLASGSGTLSGLGSSFSGFASYLVQSGGSWTLSGTNTLGAATTLTNRGTLTAAALFKDTGSIANFGLIASGVGVYVGSGQVTNGSASNTTALISGGATGLAVSHLGSLSNFGTVAGGALGVRWVGGSLINGPQGDTLAQITGAYGVSLTGAATTLKNFGQILGASGGAVYIGSIDAGATVMLTNGAYNDATALISGGEYGISVNAAAATVTNYGTIAGAGGTALTFNSASDLLIVEGGSAFAGAVQGGGGTLQLASGTGTLSGLGSSFSGFASYMVQNGGSWTLNGTNTLGAATTLTNRGTLTAASLFRDAGSIANLGTFTGRGGAAGSHNQNSAAPGGAGGLAIQLTGGALTDGGAITGGAGGAGGGYVPHGYGGVGGAGGVGVQSTGGAATNSGAITGGAGGAGGGGYNGGGTGGSGGTAFQSTGGALTNSGTITGGVGGSGGKGTNGGTRGRWWRRPLPGQRRGRDQQWPDRRRGGRRVGDDRRRPGRRSRGRGCLSDQRRDAHQQQPAFGRGGRIWRIKRLRRPRRRRRGRGVGSLCS